MFHAGGRHREELQRFVHPWVTMPPDSGEDSAWGLRMASRKWWNAKKPGLEMEKEWRESGSKDHAKMAPKEWFHWDHILGHWCCCWRQSLDPWPTMGNKHSFVLVSFNDSLKIPSPRWDHVTEPAFRAARYGQGERVSPRPPKPSP